MTAPEEILRDRLLTALRSAETSAPRLQVPYGAMVDAILALGDLECRWEVLGGDPDDPDDRWYYRTDNRVDAEEFATAKRAVDLRALFLLRFTPISVEQDGVQ